MHFCWSDIITRYENVTFPFGFVKHFPQYLAFFLDGSVLRYAKASGRYCGFTVYPMLLIFLFAAVAGAVVYGLNSFIELPWILAAGGFIALFLILCKYPGDLFYVGLSVNDWAFARDMCNSANPDISERFDLFSNEIVREISTSNPDEIIIVGHSFGSVWAAVALAAALERNPGLLEGKRTTFLALGSSLLKIGLVKRATFFVEAIERLRSEKRLLWHEIQTKTDFISFYKTDPFEVLQLGKPACEVIVHRVNFKQALSASRHRKMLKSMYLAHRQYILYCDERVHHDFQLRVFGPFFADDLARDTKLALQSPFFPDRKAA